MTPDSAGYTITEALREGGPSGLYRAVRLRDQARVIVERPHLEVPARGQLERLRHEHAMGRLLAGRFVLRPLELDARGAPPCLVFEDFDGELLARRLGQPIAVGDFFAVAIALAAALSDLHRRGVVHNALSPDSILVHRSTEGLRLIDLGSAASLVRAPFLSMNGRAAGADPAYLSPEQTGRMSRGVDHRSDLYSLGLVCYAMLTGALPFQAADSLGWVHCHLAQAPRPPTELVPSLPETLAELVLKLLAKQPEQRYQTASGVQADLERCARDWQAQGGITPFQLGSRNVPDSLMFPERLYGRHEELESLVAAFARVAAGGGPELVLVRGYSGVGKSAVVNEFRTTRLPPGALFAAGKFDQNERGTPYGTIAQALQSLVRYVLGKGDEEVATWRAAAQEAVGPNGRLLTALVPELALLIGEQPPMQDVPMQDAQHRFNLVVRRLLDVFARPEHPLVLFLDDLQWLDAATLQLLEHLLTHPAVRQVLLLGCFRDNEVGPLHPLTLALDAMRKAGAATRIITLGPLVQSDVLRLTAGVLSCAEDDASPLAELVYAKTGGNPFFVIQFLTTLVEDGLLVFDASEGRWRWDLARIRGTGFTDNVADLMVSKLARLHAETQASLKLLACLGTRARLATLAAVRGGSEEQAEDSLLEAIQLGLLFHHEDSLTFLHDRVLEAAYALIAEKDRPAVHLSVGRKLLARAEPSGLEEVLFDVVSHLNRGAESMTDPAERTRLAELDAAAGRRARASIAYATAKDLFATAVRLLPAASWRERHDFTFELYLDLAEAQYSCGAFEEADSLLDGVLEQARDPIERARVYGLKLAAYPMAGRYDDAVAMGTCALQLLGEELPRDDEALARAIEVEARAVKDHLQGRSIPELASTPEATDPRVKAVTHLLTAMAGPTYIGSRPQLFPLLALKNLRAFLEHGATKSGIHGVSAYALLLMGGFADPRDGHAFSQVALKLAERFGDRGVLGDALYMHGNHVNFWLEPIATDFPILERGFRACLDAGNLVFANYIAYSIVWQAVERGDALVDVLELSRRYASFALESKNVAIHQTIVLEQQFLKCLMGDTEGPSSFSDSGTSEASCLEQASMFTCGVAYYHVMKALVAHLLSDDAAARTHAEQARRVLPAVAAQPMEATFCFLQALALLRACDEAGPERTGLLDEVKACQTKLASWAARCPANFATKHLLVSARVAEHDGDELLAERLFERAVETARESGFLHWEAMAHEEAAAFHERRGLATLSRAYRREARSCYARWGAVAKVRQLEASHAWLQEPVSAGRGSAAAPLDQLDRLDLESIIKAQHAISAEVDPARLTEALLRIVLESAGAQVGFLSVEGAGELRAEVQPARGGGEQVRIVPGAARVPESIVNYVRRSRLAVLLDDAGSRAGDFVADEYLRRFRPKSVLCVAIQRQEKLLGVLYLENNLVVGAFTPERRFIIEALAAQAAISLETAGLYQALQASEERLRLTLEAAHIGVFDWDVSRDLWRGSRVYYTMLGYPPRSEPGHRAEWLARVHPDDRELVETKIRAVLTKTSSAESYEYVARLRHADGAYRWQHVKGFSIERDSAGHATRILGVRMDITARREAEEELARHREHLEELVRLRTEELQTANTELEAFAYSVSHDLRAPLRRIEGFIGLLEKHLAGSLDEQGRHYLRTLTASSQRAQLLIGDLLSFSRMSRSEMVTAQVDLRELAEEVLQEAARDAGGRNVTWVVSPLPVVTGDRAMLRVVLVNLVANALKFTRPRALARIEVDCEVGEGNETVVVVRDNGVGFDMRYADRLFGVFRRLHRDEDFEGTGIGLAIVRRIISRHGGRVWARGAVDQGATFSFTLPRRVPDQE